MRYRPRGRVQDVGPVTPNDVQPAETRLGESVRVLVVAGVRLYREGMSFNLGNREGLNVVGSAATRAEAIQLVTTLQPAVVVLDMATDRSLDLVRAIKDVDSRVKIIAFAVDEHEREIIACAEAGVDGYVSCEGSMDELTATITSVTRDELICSPKVAATLLRRVGALANGVRTPHGTDGLTTRECDVLGLIDEGLSNKQIAVRLHIEVATVKNHVHNLLEKLRVASRVEAALQLGARSVRRRGRL
jgi:two-component system, NarL family, nitrate/nitrite response regulator NarL